MKKLISLFLFCSLITGCASTHVPAYVRDKKPFTRRFYADHQKVLDAVQEALAKMGWAVSEVTNPQLFEFDAEKQSAEKKSLIITKVKMTRMLLMTRYARMNVYIYSTGDVSEVEMRYLVINGMPIFRPKSYGSESLAKRFFELVETHLKQ